MAADKVALRAELRRIRSALSASERAAATAAIHTHLVAVSALHGAETVAVYSAIRDELDIEAVAHILRSRGVTTVYPRVVPGQRQLHFHPASGPDQLHPSSYGIPEPPADHPLVTIESIDVVLLPGLGFDASGSRLGWGGGYYDRTLAPHPHVARVGVAFECQVLEEIPMEPGDVAVHYLVTERGARPAVQVRPGA